MVCTLTATQPIMDAQPQMTTNTEQSLASAQPTHAYKRKHGDPVLRRTMKYLTICKDPRAYSAAVRAAPDDVIRAIANAAYNIERGPAIYLSPSQKALFRKHRQAIATLTSPAVSIKRKRKVVGSQKGGFPFLPLLIGSAIGALGGKLFGGQQQH